jgi:hypothetical protein
MIALNLSRTELELLVKAIDIAALAGWPPGEGDKVRVSVLKQQIEKKITELRSQGWQGRR